MRIPTILGTRYFRDWSRCHIRVRWPQNPPEIIFALFYTKMNENSRRRYVYPPSWAPGIYRTEPDAIFVFSDLKNPQKQFCLYYIPRWMKTPEEGTHTHHPGHEWFRDQSQCHIRVRRHQKIPEIFFALIYTRINKNSRRRCAHLSSWAPGISGTEADIIFVFGDLKKTQK